MLSLRRLDLFPQTYHCPATSPSHPRDLQDIAIKAVGELWDGGEACPTSSSLNCMPGTFTPFPLFWGAGGNSINPNPSLGTTNSCSQLSFTCPDHRVYIPHSKGMEPNNYAVELIPLPRCLAIYQYLEDSLFCSTSRRIYRSVDL